MTLKPIIVAVDGPAGSGKSSLCEAVSQKLGWSYFTSGAIYRVIGLLAHQKNLNLSDDATICRLVDQHSSDIYWDLSQKKVFFQDQDLTVESQSAESGTYASLVATLPGLRLKLLPLLRKIVLQAQKGIIVDGRDIGTVVFPEADVKIFLTASVATRAKRRMDQLKARKTSEELPSFESLLQAIEHRDAQDSQRDIAPLKPAPDAHIFDNSLLSFPECVSELIRIIRTP